MHFLFLLMTDVLSYRSIFSSFFLNLSSVCSLNENTKYKPREVTLPVKTERVVKVFMEKNLKMNGMIINCLSPIIVQVY